MNTNIKIYHWVIAISMTLIGQNIAAQQPRNNIWQKKNPWFEMEVVPFLQQKIKEILESNTKGASVVRLPPQLFIKNPTF